VFGKKNVRMSNAKIEIAALEERLRLAELGPFPAVFEELLADDAILVAQDGQPTFAKAQVVAAHQPGAGPKFTRVVTSDLKIVDHGSVAVVTCNGHYEGPQFTGTLKFMRVWMMKKTAGKSSRDRYPALEPDSIGSSDSPNHTAIPPFHLP
jgi:ketosteroid isomerase-like protein